MNNLVIDLTHGGVKIAISLAKKGRNVIAYDIYNTLKEEDESLLNTYDIKIIKDLDSFKEEIKSNSIKKIGPAISSSSINKILSFILDLFNIYGIIVIEISCINNFSYK